MKKLLYIPLICLLAIICSSCKKSAIVPATLVGTWELRQVSGSFTTNYPAGNGHILKFTATGYERYDNDTLTKKGVYTTMPDSTVEQNVCLIGLTNTYKTRIVYDNKYNTTKVFIHITSTELNSISGCFAYDGGSKASYQRQ
jgi:hypothetical protein